MNFYSRLFLFSLLLLPGAFVQAQDFAHLPNSDVTTGIDSVKVFFDGAQIYRHVEAAFPQGQSTVTFKGLSSHLISSTVQPGIQRGPRIISSSVNTSYLELNNYTEEVQRVKDSLGAVSREIAVIKARIKGLEVEKGLLMKNDKLGGEESAVSTSDLERAAVFYRERFEKIAVDIYDAELKIQELEQVRQRLSLSISRYMSLSNQPTSDVVITVESPRPAKVLISLQYVVGKTGWAPRYDIRSSGIDEDVHITYMADVYNATGINWENVKLTLSTADPTQSAQLPSLEPWVLNWDDPNMARMIEKAGYLNTMALDLDAEVEEEMLYEPANDAWGADEWDDEAWGEEPAPAAPSVIAVSELTVDYRVTGAYTVVSSEDLFQVTVREETVATTYSYTAVPKVQPTAFLIARLTGWERLNLLSGPTSIYFGGTYIGDSFIDPRTSRDTLNISMGKDDKVLITRTKMSDFTKKQTIGSNTKETFRYKISVRNTNSTPVTIKILDQVPVSQVNDIEVDINELSGASHRERNGELTWDFTLPSTAVKSLEFEFEVKYPKDRKLILRKSRNIERAARFRF